jgi:hypothetical protein
MANKTKKKGGTLQKKIRPLNPNLNQNPDSPFDVSNQIVIVGVALNYIDKNPKIKNHIELLSSVKKFIYLFKDLDDKIGIATLEQDREFVNHALLINLYTDLYELFIRLELLNFFDRSDTHFKDVFDAIGILIMRSLEYNNV